MIKYLTFLLLFTSCAQTKILETKEVSFEFLHFTHSRQPFLLPTNRAVNEINLNVNLSLLNDYMFIDNTVHSQTDIYQYRLIGWHYKVGFRLIPRVDFYFEHFSQHLLDYIPFMDNTYDGIGVKIYLYEKK
jgi:hypothetical protein